MMVVCRQSTPSKRAKVAPGRLGAGGSFTITWLPRPAAWPPTGQMVLPRNADGINEYLYILSLRHPDAIRCVPSGTFGPAPNSPVPRRRVLPTPSLAHRRGGGRGRMTRWEISPAASDLRVHEIRMRQHYETPAAVVATVRRLWSPDFDAMASPINAVCSDYATLEENVFSMQLHERCIFVNPAYAPDDAWRGEGGIGLALDKLIGDVRERGCTLIALLPNLSHSEWYARCVDTAHEVHMVTGELVFPNPYLDLPRSQRSYLWQCRSYVLVVWRSEARPSSPHYARLTLDALPDSHPSTQLHVRSCRMCGRVRVLPRYHWVPEMDFVCSMSSDSKYNSCDAPEWVPRCTT